MVFSNLLNTNSTPSKIVETKISKFQISNFEVLNLDSSHFVEYFFKRNNGKEEGFSFFSPFYEKPQLNGAKISSTKIDSGVEVILAGNEFTSKFRISNLKISTNNSTAEIDIIKDGVSYKSNLYGTNLSEESILEKISKFYKNSMFLEEDCHSFGILAVIAIVVTFLNAKNA